ncbi:carboxymuconolactone decarboxylase family protein [Actinoplanes friuliensis]|uniref:Putative carboxymuconolactone decarboxylase n=1 Tax=Actinoplanes friuliensis DSM 7358 TaxID=1246995 RepID=U5W6Z4_9ACTN|nr:carboxymuconolactone decarboxylase family protein [Actinoplanes friuliensis]AGZ44973.1 putative carboxymuconolactone decarboxylase [Actinoplanes friuliensis DSM 7358]
MPHINLPNLPGIVGLLVQFPQTAGPLNGLADALLRGPSPLTPAERETIAAYVSSRNKCTFCAETHGAVARHLGQPEEHSPKMQALLALADKVRVDGRSVTPADIDQARAEGADDKTIHDTVLIAAAFSMFNRYVDGLATLTPENPAAYAQHAKNLAQGGYLTTPQP